jgi:hypothetical protein
MLINTDIKEKSMEVPQKKRELSYELAFPLLDIYPKEMK